MPSPATPCSAWRSICCPDKTVEKVAYGTEASFFQDYGVPSIVCGPGSIEQAHKADEFVTLEQLALCDRFMDGVVARMAAGGLAAGGLAAVR